MEVTSVSFSPDGRLALSGSYDSTIRLWDIESCNMNRTLGHREVTSVSFSPDGHFALSGSGDYTIILWDIESEEEIAEIRGYTGALLSCAFSPGGESIVYGNHLGNVALVSIENLDASPPFVKAYAKSGRLYSQCPFCGKKMKLREAVLGERIHCSRCRRPYLVKPYS